MSLYDYVNNFANRLSTDFVDKRLPVWNNAGFSKKSNLYHLRGRVISGGAGAQLSWWYSGSAKYHIIVVEVKKGKVSYRVEEVK